MVTDTIGDYLTRIRNALIRKKDSVTMPSSKMLVALSEILKKEKFIDDFAVEKLEGTDRDNLIITLRYRDGESAIRKLERVSKPGVRRYVRYKNIPKVLGGIGVVVLTTPKGVMTGKQAYNERVGGEILCKVW